MFHPAGLSRCCCIVAHSSADDVELTPLGNKDSATRKLNTRLDRRKMRARNASPLPAEEGKVRAPVNTPTPTAKRNKTMLRPDHSPQITRFDRSWTLVSKWSGVGVGVFAGVLIMGD